jgi:hypothetical protein
MQRQFCPVSTTESKTIAGLGQLGVGAMLGNEPLEGIVTSTVFTDRYRLAARIVFTNSMT